MIESKKCETKPSLNVKFEFLDIYVSEEQKMKRRRRIQGDDWRGSLLLSGVESSSSLCLCLPPSLKIHYTPANGDLMRTSLVERPSCAAQRRLIAA